MYNDSSNVSKKRSGGMDVLEKLKKLQNERGWSDYRISKEAGLSQGTVSNVYKRNTIPNLFTLEAICKAFGLTLSQFFADNDMIELTPELKELFENWVRLPENKRDLFLQMIKSSI